MQGGRERERAGQPKNGQMGNMSDDERVCLCREEANAIKRLQQVTHSLFQGGTSSRGKNERSGLGGAALGREKRKREGDKDGLFREGEKDKEK